MPDSSESTGLQPQKEGNQSTAPGFQPSGGIASTTRGLTHAVRSQYFAKHTGEDRAIADRREYNNAKKRAYARKWRAGNREKYIEYQRKWYAAKNEKS